MQLVSSLEFLKPLFFFGMFDMAHDSVGYQQTGTWSKSTTETLGKSVKYV